VRGDGHVGPDHRDERRTHRAGRPAGRDLPPAGVGLRRRLHRAGELPARDARGVHRRGHGPRPGARGDRRGPGAPRRAHRRRRRPHGPPGVDRPHRRACRRGDPRPAREGRRRRLLRRARRVRAGDGDRQHPRRRLRPGRRRDLRRGGGRQPAVRLRPRLAAAPALSSPGAPSADPAGGAPACPQDLHGRGLVRLGGEAYRRGRHVPGGDPMARSTWTRWLPAGAVVALIAGTVTLTSQAGAVDLPDKSPEDVLALLAEHEVTAFSGTFETSADLGLPLPSDLDLGPGGPDLDDSGLATPPDGGGAAPDDATGAAQDVLSTLALLTGDNTGRVFVAGPGTARFQHLDRLDERNVVVTPEDVWFYDSES